MSGLSLRPVATMVARLVLLGAVFMPMAVMAQGTSESAHLCHHGGYATYTTEVGGAPFTNPGQCVRFAAQGNPLVPVAAPSATLSFRPMEGVDFGCYAQLSVSNHAPGSYTVQFSGHGFRFPLTVDADGTGTVASDDLAGPPVDPENPDRGVYAAYGYPRGYVVTASIDGTAIATEVADC